MNTIVGVVCFTGVPAFIVSTIFALKFAHKVDSFLNGLETASLLSLNVIDEARKDFIRCMLTFTFAIVAIIINVALIAFAL